MFNRILRLLCLSFTITTTILAFVPDSVVSCVLPINVSGIDGLSLLISRLIICICLFALISLFRFIGTKFRNKIVIKGDGYIIEVTYKNLFQVDNCKKVINFDECFTTTVGERPEDIKSSSVCGQYLSMSKLNEADIQRLSRSVGKQPRSKSLFQERDSYQPGSILPNGDYLLMAFAKLSKNGRAEITRKEYIDCLNNLWDEIDMFHSDKNVAIPILGSNITSFGELYLSQQELLDIMIATYKMSKSKLKKPCKLIICCKKADDFSLNKIGTII